MKMATILHKEGIKEGDVVAVYGLSSYRFFSASLSILMIGIIIIILLFKVYYIILF